MTRPHINLSIITGTILLAAILAKLRVMMEKQVPMGYQDENGFHFGVESANKKNSWSPVG